jgi:hypothetical protein
MRAVRERDHDNRKKAIELTRSAITQVEEGIKFDN